MTDLDVLATELGVSGRTLRRAASKGLVRAASRGGGGYAISAGERRYLRRHWPLLEALVGRLRTAPNVRLAVLFGSSARGDATTESDLDLLVRLARPEGLARVQLSQQLSERLDREVQVVSLDEAERTPLLLADILREGRVLVDRDREWPSIRRRARSVDRHGRREEARLERAAWETIDSLAT